MHLCMVLFMRCCMYASLCGMYVLVSPLMFFSCKAMIEAMCFIAVSNSIIFLWHRHRENRERKSLCTH